MTTAKKTTKKTAKKTAPKTKKLTFSPNKKLNYVLKDIYEYLEEYGIEEIENNKKLFPRAVDYEIAQGGGMRIYFDDIRKLYKRAGYTGVDKWSNDKLWETYKRQVGYVADRYF